MPGMTITKLSKTYGAATVVDDFNLRVDQGELVVFLGPSGCGKTTTLRMIAGFVEPSHGSIEVGGRDITRLPSYDRNIGVVFQNYALFPHLTVFENVAFGLRRRKVGDTLLRTKVAKALEMVAMDHLAHRMPSALSGGQQQRVAIARAVVIEPDLLLLDEPLSNLDAKLRLNIRQEIRRLQKLLGITTILVTHDQEEAMSIADRLVVMSNGKVQQVGTPETVYAEPVNSFVADFIGGANFLLGRTVGGEFETQSGLRLQARSLPPGCRCIVIRPEQIRVVDASQAASNDVQGLVTSLTFLGAGRLIEVGLATGEILNVYLGAGEGKALRNGETVMLHLPAHDIFGIQDDPTERMAAAG